MWHVIYTIVEKKCRTKQALPCYRDKITPTRRSMKWITASPLLFLFWWFFHNTTSNMVRNTLNAPGQDTTTNSALSSGPTASLLGKRRCEFLEAFSYFFPGFLLDDSFQAAFWKQCLDIALAFICSKVADVYQKTFEMFKARFLHTNGRLSLPRIGLNFDNFAYKRFTPNIFFEQYAMWKEHFAKHDQALANTISNGPSKQKGLYH